jgi:putative salt-induced outer membrane protein
MKQDAASSGKTDVAAKGFASAAELEDEEKAKDATEVKLSAGGLFTAGNSRNSAITSAGKLRLRRSANEFSSAVAANYARSASDPDSDLETTVENFQGTIRYDRFLSEHVALFLAASALHDRFQGLDLRVNIDPGVAYYFINQKKQRLRGELGYDLQYDIRRDENIEEAAAEGEQVDKTEVRHNARLFAGYDNSINEAVSFNTGLEYLQSVQESTNWRLNWDAGLSSSIGGNFSAATTFTLKYDHNPLPGVEQLDMITAVSLVYQLI